MWSVRASFFDHLVAERDAFRIVLLEPLIGKLWRREYLEVVDVANLLVGIDINPNGCHWSLLSFRRPQCVFCEMDQTSVRRVGSMPISQVHRATIKFLCRVYKEAPEPSSHSYPAMRISCDRGF